MSEMLFIDESLLGAKRHIPPILYNSSDIKNVLSPKWVIPL